jgi:hypothetical protein
MMSFRVPLLASAATGLLLWSGCAPESGTPGDDHRFRELEQRFTPGLHSLMVELGMRHALTWFAGDAGNWPLADHMVHELEELIEDIEEMHPVYRDVQVAAMLRDMTSPAVEALEDAVEARDRAAFAAAFDELTTACNHCHVASGKSAIVIQRPTAPPLTNLRFDP